MWMDNKRGIVQPTLCVDNKKDKTELQAMCDWQTLDFFKRFSPHLHFFF